MVAVIFRLLDAAHLRPDLCIDRQQQGHHVHVGHARQQPGGFPGGGLRFGGPTLLFPDQALAPCCTSASAACASTRTNMQRLFARLGFYLLVTVIVQCGVSPFYYAIVTSFKTGPELFSVDYFPCAGTGTTIAVFEQPFAHNIFNSVLVSLPWSPCRFLLG